MRIPTSIALHFIFLICSSTCAADPPLQFFGVPKGIEKVARLEGHKGSVADTLQLPDGKLMTAGSDGTIRLWNLATCEQLEVVAEETEPITKLQLLRDQMKVLSFSANGGITVYQLPQPKRGWGPEQAAGSPDSGSGDQRTAWASASQDDQPEWLVLEYAEPVAPVQIQIFENYNPGAVVKITAFDKPEAEVTLWEAAANLQPQQGFGQLSVPIETADPVKRIKLYIDSPKVAGWNEIDAVGLVDASGKLHWATAAAASSTYAERSGGERIQFTR